MDNKRKNFKNNKPRKEELEKLNFKASISKSKVEEKEIEELKKLYETCDTRAFKTFNEFPLSKYMQKGIFDAKYHEPTEIQKQSILPALKGNDILGAAKTGSGKTLAFIIPVLELLYRERWSSMDSLGALIITPTRELAYQIFEVINKVGHHHEFSVGLIIGGKDLKFERKRLYRCNIVIGTPGRLLQHMDENALFNTENLRILVLDEADRILDMGFAKTMNAIIDNLPPSDQRQTLLFSATQTKSVEDLARLSLKHPVYISVDENANKSTPDSLQQSYVVCNLEEKLDILYSFIKAHKKQKILIFLSSCKQVKYIYELFCHLRPGISLFALYGTLHQLKRMAIYDRFKEKEHCVMFATDIASRGLDFPSVNWVVQADCPEDVNTYIHRAGRTARYKDGGESLLMLTENEEKMIERLTARKIPIEKIEINVKKLTSIVRKAEAFCARDVQVKDSAQRAFKAYLKNYFLMKDKEIFDIEKIDLNAFARSLGLVVTPRVRFIENAKRLRNAQRNKQVNEKKKQKSDSDEESDDDDQSDNEEENNEDEEEIKTNKSKSKAVEFTFGNDEDDEDDNDDLLTVKRIHNFDIEDTNKNDNKEEKEKAKKLITKASIAKKLSKKHINVNKKIVFDEDGNPIEEFPREQTSEKLEVLQSKIPSGIDIELAKEIMKDEDKIDRQLQKQIIKAKHRERKMKLKEKLKGINKYDDEEENDEQDENDYDSKEMNENSEENLDENEDDNVSEDDQYEDVDEESLDELTSRYIDELPDPDKIYKSKNSDDDDSDEDDESSEDDSSDEETDDDNEEEGDKYTRKNKRRKLDENNLFDDEELALQLLNARK